MLVKDLDIFLTNADLEEIKVISNIIREMALFSMLAKNLVTLQNFVEARI